MKLKPPKRAESYIPTASMADIAFLLIVFFMVTTTISVDRTTVQLPTSMERGETPKDSAVIAIEENGVIHFSDGEVHGGRHDHGATPPGGRAEHRHAH